MSDADLWSADLTNAYLCRANLSGADLVNADLQDAALVDADLQDASLQQANLSGATLSKVNLSGADLWGVTGNMREIKSAQFDRWGIAWMQDSQGLTVLQIGCQRHSLQTWKDANEDWISTLDSKALKWWRQYRDIILALVEISPATPHAGVEA